MEETKKKLLNEGREIEKWRETFRMLVEHLGNYSTLPFEAPRNDYEMRNIALKLLNDVASSASNPQQTAAYKRLETKLGEQKEHHRKILKRTETMLAAVEETQRELQHYHESCTGPDELEETLKKLETLMEGN